MSELVPWDDDYKPSRPTTVVEAIKQTTLWMPRPFRAEFVDLFLSMESLAHKRGKPWGIEASSSLAYRIRMAIDDYRQKDASHGLEPSKVERTLRSSQGLAHKLKAILLSEEGQERFAPILEQGYTSDQIDSLFGPDIRENLLIVLLDQIERDGPMTADQSAAFRYRSRKRRYRPEMEAALSKAALQRQREQKAYEEALISPAGQELQQRRQALGAALRLPKAHDPIRRKLIADSIECICRCLGADAEQSLVTGENRPRAILEEMVSLILEFVGQHRGAPKFEAGKETANFRNGLAFATYRAQLEDINGQLRVLAQEHLSTSDE